MSKRPTYIGAAIFGTISVIVAGAFGLPELLTGDADNGFVNILILFSVMLLTVSLFVFVRERKHDRTSLGKTIVFALLWSMCTLAMLVLIFFVVFNFQ